MFFFTDFYVNPYSKEELEGYINIFPELLTLDKGATNDEKVKTQRKSLVDCTKEDLDTSFH